MTLDKLLNPSRILVENSYNGIFGDTKRRQV